MKSKIVQFLMLVGLTVGLAAFAQAQKISTYDVTIPFNFIVGEKSFKAGNYTIQFGVFQSDYNNFIIKSSDSKQSVIVTGFVPKNNYDIIIRSNLVFNVSNEHYYLSEVNTSRTSVELYDSRPEEKTRKTNKKVEVALAK